MLYALTLLIVPISGAGLAGYSCRERLSKRFSKHLARTPRYVEHVTSAESWIAPDVARIWFGHTEDYSIGSENNHRLVSAYPPPLATAESSCDPIV